MKKDGQFVLVCLFLSIFICRVVLYKGMNACNQPKTTEGLFYNGYDLVEYFMRDANAKMMDYMNELSNK